MALNAEMEEVVRDAEERVEQENEIRKFTEWKMRAKTQEHQRHVEQKMQNSRKGTLQFQQDKMAEMLLSGASLPQLFIGTSLIVFVLSSLLASSCHRWRRRRAASECGRDGNGCADTGQSIAAAQRAGNYPRNRGTGTTTWMMYWAQT